MVGKDELTFFGYHVVCLIDVLGQKQKLEKWNTIPEGGKPTPEFIQAIKRTVGTVLGYREHYLAFFEQVGSETLPKTFDALPKDWVEKYRRAKNCRVHVERHSDSFVFSSQITNPQGDASTDAAYRILCACCMAMVISLAAKIPVRGAVTVGMGAVLEDGGFYGPALAEAHFIESEVCGYPRIVVSPTVLEFLISGRAYSQDLEVEKIMRLFAKISRPFICEDTDGRFIVDYLGNGFRQVDSSITELVGKAYDFARSEEISFGANGDQKLADRYRLLRQYVESRLPLWGVPIA